MTLENCTDNLAAFVKNSVTEGQAFGSAGEAAASNADRHPVPELPFEAWLLHV